MMRKSNSRRWPTALIAALVGLTAVAELAHGRRRAAAASDDQSSSFGQAGSEGTKEVVQLVRCKGEDGNWEMIPHQENMEAIQRELVAANVDQVSIVSVMGTYRSGKSLLLDMLRTYLKHEQNVAQPEVRLTLEAVHLTLVNFRSGRL